jgi:hypothetical protein
LAAKTLWQNLQQTSFPLNLRDRWFPYLADQEKVMVAATCQASASCLPFPQPKVNMPSNNQRANEDFNFCANIFCANRRMRH